LNCPRNRPACALEVNKLLRPADEFAVLFSQTYLQKFSLQAFPFDWLIRLFPASLGLHHVGFSWHKNPPWDRAR
jgi:hypothetical protein